MLDVDGRNEFRFLAFNKYLFHFWLLASAPKNLAFARKMTALPDSRGLQPPQTLARTPMLILEMVV